MGKGDKNKRPFLPRESQYFPWKSCDESSEGIKEWSAKEIYSRRHYGEAAECVGPRVVDDRVKGPGTL